jgi:hypothetical protein
MFKDIIRGFSKFFTKERVLVLIIFLILAWALYSYSGSKTLVMDRMSDGSAPNGAPVAPQPVANAASTVQQGGAAAPSGYALQPVANPSDLLPKDANSQWASLNPSSMNKGDILMPDLLQAGYHIGLDTIGQTLRNPNLQLRSDPVIQKSEIGPWNQSTIEPDFARVPLELGH